MIPVNYHHLYYFWTTVKHGSISAARKKLLVAQPTLSLQLRRLEKEMGKTLLRRSRRGVSPTDEGRVVFEYCERIFPLGERLAARVKQGPSSGPSLLQLGIEENVPRDAVVRILDHMNKKARGVRVRIVGGGLRDLKERLSRHALDILISDVDAGQIGRDYIGRLKGVLPIVFVAAPKLAALVRRFPRDLAGVPLLLRTSGNPVRKEVDLYLHRHKVSVSVDAEIEDADIIRRLALKGRGAAALNAASVAKDLEQGRLVALNPKALGIVERVWLTAGRHPKPDPRLQAVIQDLLYDFSL